MPKRKPHNPNPKIEITEDQIKQIETMAGLGLRNDQMAAILGFSKDTLERRANENPALAAALEKGRALAASTVTRTAFDMARSGRHPTMTIFWLKCRQNWRETTVVEHQGQQGGPIRYASLSDEQLESLLTTTIERITELKDPNLNSKTSGDDEKPKQLPH